VRTNFLKKGGVIMLIFNGRQIVNTKGYSKIWVETVEDGYNIMGRCVDGYQEYLFCEPFPELEKACEFIRKVMEHYDDDKEIYWSED
jgi:hypothetical protein